MQNFETVIPVLKEISNLTDSVILRYPQTVAISDSQDVLMRINFETMGAEKFDEIPLMNSVSSLSNLLGLFSEHREVDIQDGVVNVRENELSSTFITDSVLLMEEYEVPVEQFDRTADVPSVAQFTISKSDINKLNSASSVFADLTDVEISCRSGHVTIGLGAKGKFNASSNTFSINYPDAGSKDFDTAIPVSSFKSIPNGDWHFMVKYNSKQDAYRIYLNSESLENSIDMILAVKN